MACDKCCNTGWETYFDEEGRTYVRECSCGIRQKQIMSGKLKFADVPEAFKDERLKNFSLSIYSPKGKEAATKACTTVKFWLNHLDEMQQTGKGLYLYSRSKGSGKTKLATCIANELLYELNKSVKFCTSMQIINAIKETWHDGQMGSESRLLNDLGQTQFLIIDDFGAEKIKDWIEERFFTIMNQRYVDKKVTIITSNYSIDELPYDDRIKDRIAQCCFQIQFPEESVRRKIALMETAQLEERVKNDG